MTDTIELPETLTNSAQAASFVCNSLPDIAEEFDADVGATALILCGFLAGKIVGEGEGLITKEYFFKQMTGAIAAMNAHSTEQ